MIDLLELKRELDDDFDDFVAKTYQNNHILVWYGLQLETRDNYKDYTLEEEVEAYRNMELDYRYDDEDEFYLYKSVLNEHLQNKLDRIFRKLGIPEDATDEEIYDKLEECKLEHEEPDYEIDYDAEDYDD